VKHQYSRILLANYSLLTIPDPLFKQLIRNNG